MISKGITLGYKTSSSGSTYTNLTGLQEIPELGGEKESLEITTLADEAHVYENGLISYGDNIAFKFLYETAQFNTLSELAGSISWQVKLPDNTTCTFSGEPSVKLDGVGTNATLTYTLSIKPNSSMVWGTAA